MRDWQFDSLLNGRVNRPAGLQGASPFLSLGTVEPAAERIHFGCAPPDSTAPPVLHHSPRTYLQIVSQSPTEETLSPSRIASPRPSARGRWQRSPLAAAPIWPPSPPAWPRCSLPNRGRHPRELRATPHRPFSSVRDRCRWQARPRIGTGHHQSEYNCVVRRRTAAGDAFPQVLGRLQAAAARSRRG